MLSNGTDPICNQQRGRMQRKQMKQTKEKKERIARSET